jgi:hypothetical protein
VRLLQTSSLRVGTYKRPLMDSWVGALVLERVRILPSRT